MLQVFLGDWLYWPLVAIVIAFATTAVLSNISLCYSELVDQVKEIKRQFKRT